MIRGTVRYGKDPTNNTHSVQSYPIRVDIIGQIFAIVHYPS